MTILVGFVCRDGIVIGADSEEYRGTVKVSVPKIEPYTNDWLTCIVGGSGNGDLINLALDKIQVTVNGLYQGRTLSELHQAITGVVAWIYEAKIDKLPKEVDHPDVELLWAAWEKPKKPRKGKDVEPTEANLWKTTRHATTMVRRHEAIGYGQHFAAYLIDTFYRNEHANVEQMTRLAAYVLRQTKKYAPYCGGDSKIYTLDDEGSVTEITAAAISAEEQRSDGIVQAAAQAFYLPDSRDVIRRLASETSDSASSPPGEEPR